LTAVGDRLLCVKQIIDKVLNNTDSCHLLPVLQDAQSELGEAFFDMTEWKDSKLAIMVINSILAPAHLLGRWADWRGGVNTYGLGC
jgi:hypothetical protein